MASREGSCPVLLGCLGQLRTSINPHRVALPGTCPAGQYRVCCGLANIVCVLDRQRAIPGRGEELSPPADDSKDNQEHLHFCCH